ncbi:SdpI family protein [Caldisericum sp. AR60]|uniref:SdpI family protein n=2 Tax=unclassified Caldisericum TaxID=2641600 RepID=UPI0039FCE6FC
MGNYSVILTLSVLLIVLGFLLRYTPQNSIFGLRTRSTLLDKEVWKLSNRKGAYLLCLVGFIYLLLALFLWWLKYPDETYGNYLLTSLIVVLLLVTIYLVIYSDKLFKMKNAGVKLDGFVIPRHFIFVGDVGAIFLVLLGLLMLFVPPNTWIGIRIPKTLTNPILWRNVNKISGVGFIVIGLIFALLFSKDALKPDKERSESFDKHNILFLSLTTLWALISIGIVYLF